jgi:sulfoxide reductase heme-binding subunit YedZ
VRSDPSFWLLARASGLTAYVLVTCSVLAGLVLKSRPFGTRVRPSAVTDLHRSLALLGLAAIAVHGLALLNDTTVHIDPLGLVVPGRIAYRPAWTGVGVIAAELAFVVYVSFPLRKRIGVKTWRRLHWVTYAIFVSATLHGLLGGSDSAAQWARMVYLSSLGSVSFASAWRALVPPSSRRASTVK